MKMLIVGVLAFALGWLTNLAMALYGHKIKPVWTARDAQEFQEWAANYMKEGN